PFAGADPDGTGLPWKEPPAAAVEAAKKAPTPHLADGHPDLTGFWAPAGWGYAVAQGRVTADGKTRYTQRGGEGPVQTERTKRGRPPRASRQCRLRRTLRSRHHDS